MMRGILATLAGALVTAVLQEYRRVSLQWLKIQAAIWYVKGVAQTRQIAVRIVAVVAALLLGTAGFIVFHVGLFLWLPVSLAVRGLLLAVLGLIYLLVAWLVMRRLLSEQSWLKNSGASDLIASATRREAGGE
jgi:apolipoprotein N-acyltransferase